MEPRDTLEREARTLALLAVRLRAEARRWTIPRARHLLSDAADQVSNFAQVCAASSVLDDKWTQQDAADRASRQREAVELTLQRWRVAGDEWNVHRDEPADEPPRAVLYAL